LQLGYAAYERSHPLPDYVRRAVWVLLGCRTVLLGGHIQACPDGHIEGVCYNSCRHRLCPRCAWLQVERWLAKQKGRLVACRGTPGALGEPECATLPSLPGPGHADRPRSLP